MRKYILLLFGIVFLMGCHTKQNDSEEQEVSISREMFAMDTNITMIAYGANANQALTLAEAEIHRLDKLLSTGDVNSEVSRINDNGGGKISKDIAYLLQRSIEISEKTEGAMDITIYPVMELWGFPSKDYRVPADEELLQIKEVVGIDYLNYDESSSQISFDKSGMKIDFGSIAKGYASMRVMEIFEENRVTAGMVNLGGNVQVLGNKPNGEAWRVAVQHPDSSKEEYLGVVSASDTAVITAGTYERYFEEDGTIYHHIMDPKSAKPASNGLLAVTLVTPDGTFADGMDTPLLIMGTEAAIEYCELHQEEFGAILLTEEDKLYVTENIVSKFQSDYIVNVIKRK